jgi:sugar phosphate isomerase/epimerase
VEIVRLARANGLAALEWGGDVHVPHGDIARAREVSALCRDAGLETVCYGSYYQAGHGGSGGCPLFSDVLDTAEALGAPCIRVWAGRRGAAEADAGYFARVCGDAANIAGAAAARGIRVAFEFHGGTLADTAAGAARFYEALPQVNISALWQPLPTLGQDGRNASLEAVLPRLAHTHVFHWLPGSEMERRPLAEGREAWTAWLGRLAESGVWPDCLLEFVAGDNPDNLAADADTLRSWMDAAEAGAGRCG